MGDIEIGSTNASKAVHDHSAFELSTSNLTYKVVVRDGGVDKEKTLLNSVSIKARAGQILAVVGPSGAGKSTFLDAVAGRIDPNVMQGSILVNGSPIADSFKRLSGYVMQDDQLFPMLTVRETLLFSARLRLPESMSSAEKRERVESLIQELGLGSCAGTIVGNAEHRGVSGGEKRRVSIGVDLIHDPAVLFLDEPTSGLDSTSALNVVQILHEIAESRKRTILLTIHQPSFRILELIHNFLILARGNVIYQGPYVGIVKYFHDFGKDVPEHADALEFALDLIEEEQKSAEGLENIVKFAQSRDALGSQLSSMGRESMSRLGDQSMVPDYATSFLSQLVTLSDRTLKNVLRTPELFIARIGLMVITGLVMGSLFWRVKETQLGLNNRLSFFAFSLALMIFTSSEALPIFLEERQIYIRETSRGAYRTSAYVIAGALVYLPFLFLMSLVFTAVSYFMVGLADDGASFVEFVVVGFLALAASNSYVSFFAGFVPNYIAGNTAVIATFAFMFLFSGFFIQQDFIPKPWIWVHYLSVFKYPFEMLLMIEFRTLKNACFKFIDDGTGCSENSENVLEKYSVQDLGFWTNFSVMVLFTVGYRFFFYLALLGQTKKVRK